VPQKCVGHQITRASHRIGTKALAAGRFPARFPRSTTVLIAAMALVAAVLTKRTGLTEVCGALAVGFALSAKPQWEKVVGTVRISPGQAAGSGLLRATGITVLTSDMRSFPVG
jgi:hypothetical protein